VCFHQAPSDDRVADFELRGAQRLVERPDVTARKQAVGRSSIGTAGGLTLFPPRSRLPRPLSDRSSACRRHGNDAGRAAVDAMLARCAGRVAREPRRRRVAGSPPRRR
jgi:hypothetical protein